MFVFKEYYLVLFKKESINEIEIEPMIWAYVLDVKMWYQGGFFHRFGRFFKNVWAASAYKGFFFLTCFIIELK